MKKLIFIAIISLLLMYCAPKSSYSNGWVSGSGGNTTVINTTTGQELLDLKQALDSGAITQEEYDELRKKIMERVDVPVDSN